MHVIVTTHEETTVCCIRRVDGSTPLYTHFDKFDVSVMNFVGVKGFRFVAMQLTKCKNTPKNWETTTENEKLKNNIQANAKQSLLPPSPPPPQRATTTTMKNSIRSIGLHYVSQVDPSSYQRVFPSLNRST